jgi:hypothetical protein
MKISLPHWASLALIAAGGAIEALSGSFPAYSVVLKVGGGIVLTLGTTGVLSLPGAGPLAPLAARLTRKVSPQ